MDEKSYIKKYRDYLSQQNIPHKNFTDDQILYQYGKEAEAGGHLDKMPNLARMYRQSNARIQRERDGLMHYPNQLVEGLKKGGNIAGGTVFGGIGLIGDTVGVTTPGSDSLAEEFMRDAGKAKTTVKSLKDAETFADYADFFVAGVGEIVPTMVTMAGTGGATGLLAGASLKVAPQVMQKKIVGKAISKEIKKRGPSKSSASLIADKNKAFAELGKEGQDIARRYAQAWGAAGGTAAASGTMGMGEVYTSLLPYTRLPETHEDYIPLEDAQAYSFAFGSAIGALDSVVPSILGGKVLRRFFPGKTNISAIDAARADNFVKKSLFKAMGAGMALEGTTEATQEWLSIAADKFAHARQDDSAGFGEDLAGAFSDPDFYRLLDAGVLGAIGGGVAGGAFTLAGNTGVPKRQEQKQSQDDAVQAARLRNAGFIEDAQKNLEDRAKAIYDRKALEEGDEVFLATGQEATYIRPVGEGRGEFQYTDTEGNKQNIVTLISPPFATPKLSASKSVVDAYAKNTRRQAVQKAGEDLLDPKQPSDPSIVDNFKKDAGAEKQEKKEEAKVNQAEIARNEKNDQDITNGDQAAYDALESTIYDAGITSDVLIGEEFTPALKRAVSNDVYTEWVKSNYDLSKEGTPSKEDMLNAFRRAHKVIHKDGRQTSADQQAEEAKKAAEEAQEESVRKQQEVERKAQENELNDRKADIQAKSYQKEDGGKVKFLTGGFKKELASNPNIGDLADAEWKLVSANLENGTIDVEANGVTITADPRNFGKKKLPKTPKEIKEPKIKNEALVLGFRSRKNDGDDSTKPEFATDVQVRLAEARIKQGIKNGKTNEEIVQDLVTHGFLPVSTHSELADGSFREFERDDFSSHFASVGGGDARHGVLRRQVIDKIRNGESLADLVRKPKKETKEVEGYKKDESEIKQKGEAFDALPEVEDGTYVIKFGKSKTVIQVTEDGWMFPSTETVGENTSRPESLTDIILRAPGKNLYDLSSIRFSDEYIINAIFDGVTFNFTLSSPVSVNMPDHEAGLNEQDTSGKFRVLDGQWVFDGGKQKTDLLNEQQHLMLKSRFSLTDDPSASTVRSELLEAKTSAKNAKQRKDMPSVGSAQIGSNESNGVIVLRHIPSGQIFLRTAVPTGAVKTGTEDVKITKFRKRNSDQPNALLTAADFNQYEQLPEVFEKIELILFSARPGSLRMRFDSLDQYENWVSGFKKFEVESKLTVHPKVPELIKKYENDKISKAHELHFALEYDIEEEGAVFSEQDGKPVVSESIGIYLNVGSGRPVWHYLKTSDILDGMSQSDGDRIVSKIYEILDDPKRGKAELGHEGLMGAMQSLKFAYPKNTEKAPPRSIDVRTLEQYFNDRERAVYDKTSAVINEANSEKAARAFVGALFEQLNRESGVANRKGREGVIIRIDKDGKSENIIEQAPDESKTPAESVSESIALEEAMEVIGNEPDPIKLGRTILFNEFNAEQLNTLHQIATQKVDFEMNKEELMDVLGLMDVTPEFVASNRVEQGAKGKLMDLPSMVANMDNPTNDGIIEVIAFVKHIGDKVDPLSIVEIIQQQNKAPSIKADEAFKLESDTYGKVNIAVRNEYEALVNKVLGSEVQLSDKQKELLSSAFSKILNAVRRPDETSGMIQDALEEIAGAFEENGMFAFMALEESGFTKGSDFKDALINAKDDANAPAISQTTADIFIEFLKNVSKQVLPNNKIHFTELLHDHLNRKVNKQGPLLTMQSEFQKLEDSTGAIYDKTSAPNKDPISEMRDPYGSDSLPFTPDITEDAMTHMENISKGQKSNTSQSKPISEQQKVRNAQAMEEVFPANLPGIDLSGVALDNIGKIISNQALPESMEFATELHRVLTQMMNARQDAGLPIINFDRTTTLSSEPGQITRGLFSPQMQTVFIDPDFYLGNADPIGEPLPITGNKEKDILMLIGMHELWHGTMEDSLHTYEEQQRRGERSELSDVIDLIDDVINEVADQAKGTKFSGLFAQNVETRRREILNRIWNRRDLAEWLSTKGVSSDLQKRIDENGEGFVGSLLDALYGAYLKLLKMLGINTDGTALKALLDLNRRLDQHYRELQPQETAVVDMAAMSENPAPVLYSKLEKVMAEATAPQIIEVDNAESLRQELNKLQKQEIPALMKAGKREEAQPLIARQKEIKQLIKDQGPKKPKTPQAPKKASGRKWINFFKKAGVSNAELKATIGALLDTEKEFSSDEVKQLVEQSNQVTLIEMDVRESFGSYVPKETWPGDLVEYKEIIVFAPQLDPVSEDTIYNIVDEEMGDGELKPGQRSEYYSYPGRLSDAGAINIETVRFDNEGINIEIFKRDTDGAIFMDIESQKKEETEVDLTPRVIRKIKAWTQRYGEIKYFYSSISADTLERFFDIEFIEKDGIPGVTIKPPSNDQLFEVEFKPDPNALFYRGLDKRIQGNMSYHWHEVELGGYGKPQKVRHHLRYGIYKAKDDTLEGRIIESQSDVENAVQADAYNPFDSATYSENYLSKMYSPEFIVHHRYSQEKSYSKGSIAIDEEAIFVATVDNPSLRPAESLKDGSVDPYSEWKPIGKRKSGAIVGYEKAKASDLKHIYYFNYSADEYVAVHAHKETIDYYTKDYTRISKGDQILKGSIAKNGVSLYDESLRAVPPNQLAVREQYIVEVQVSEDKEIEVLIDNKPVSFNIAKGLLGLFEIENYDQSSITADNIGLLEQKVVSQLDDPVGFNRSLLQENNELVAMKYFLREMAKQGITKTKIVRGDVIFPVVYRGSNLFSENVLRGDVKSAGIQAAYVRTAQKWAKLVGEELKIENETSPSKFDRYETFIKLQKTVDYYRTDNPESYLNSDVENLVKLHNTLFTLGVNKVAYFGGLEKHYNNEFITEVILSQDGFGENAKLDRLVAVDARNPFAFQEYAGEDHIFVRGTRSKDLRVDRVTILNTLEKVLTGEGVEDFSSGEIDKLMEALSPYKRVKLIEGQKESFLKEARDLLYLESRGEYGSSWDSDDLKESTEYILDTLGMPYPELYMDMDKPLDAYKRAIISSQRRVNQTSNGHEYIASSTPKLSILADENYAENYIDLGLYPSEEDAQNAVDKHYSQFEGSSVYIKSTVPYIVDTNEEGINYGSSDDEFLNVPPSSKGKNLYRVFLLDLNNVAINMGFLDSVKGNLARVSTITLPSEEGVYKDEQEKNIYYNELGIISTDENGNAVENLIEVTSLSHEFDFRNSGILRIKDANESEYGIIDGQLFGDTAISGESLRVSMPVGRGRNNLLPAGFNRIKDSMERLGKNLLAQGRLGPDALQDLGEFYTVDIPAERLSKNLYEGEPMLMQDAIDRSQIDTRTHLKITRVGDDEFKVEGLPKDEVFTARQLREGLVRFKEMPSRVGILELGENGKPLEREGHHLFREGDIKTWIPSTLLEAYDRNDASEMADQLDLNFEGKVDNSLNYIVLEPNSTDLKKGQVIPRHVARLYVGSGAMLQRYDNYLNEQNRDTDETPEIFYTEEKKPYQNNKELIKIIVRSGFPWGADGSRDYKDLLAKVQRKTKLPRARIIREINAIKRIFDYTPDGEKDFFQYELWHNGRKVYPKFMQRGSDFMSDPTIAPQENSLPSEIKPDDNVAANMKIVSASVNEASVPVAYASQDIRQLLGKPDMSLDEIWNRYLKGQSPTKEIQKLVKRYGAEMEFQTADLHKNNPNMRDETRSQTLKRLEKQIGHIHKQIANISLEFDPSRRGSIASKIAEYEDRTILDEGHLFDRARYGDRIRDKIDVLISNTEQALIEETGEEKTDPLLNEYRAITGNELTDKAFRDALIQTASTSSGGGVSANKISDLILQLSKIKEVEKLNAKAIYELVKTEFNNEGRAIIVSAVLAKEARNFIELAKLSQSKDMEGRRGLLAKLRDLSRATLGELKVLGSADAKSYFPLGNTVERGIQNKFVEDRIALLEAQEQRARKVIDQEIYQRLLEEYNLDSQKMQMLLGHNPAKQLNDGDKFPVMTKIEDGYTMSEITVRMSNFMQFENFDEIKAALRLNKKYLDDPEVKEDNDYRYVKQMQMNAEIMPIWQSHYETGGMFQMHSLKSARERFQEMGPLGREIAQMINQFEIGYKANAPRARAMSRNWNIAFDDARKAFGFKEGHKFMDQVIGPVIKWNEDQPQLSGQRQEFLEGAWEHAQKLVNKDDLSEGAEDALIKLLDAYKDKSKFHRELAQQSGLKVLDETIKMRDPMGRPFDRVRDSITKEEVEYGTHLQRNPIDRGELTVPRSLRPELIQAIINQMPQLGWSMEGSDASHTGEFNWSDLKSIVESKEIDNDTKLERLDFASAELIDDYVWEKFMVPYIDNNTSPKAFLFTPVGEEAIPRQTIEDAYQEVKALGLAGNKAFDAWAQALYERVPHREDRADFAQFKHAALVKYKQKYRQLRRSVSDIGSKGLDASITLAGHLMDSRSQSADIPIDFLRYTTYDEVTSPALVAKTMENAFFGRNAEILVSKMKQLVDETNAKHTSLKDLASIINNPRSEGRIKIKGRYKDKAYNELENNRIFENVPGRTGKDKLQNLLNAQSQMNSLLGGQLGGPGAVGHLEAYLLGDLGPFQDEKLAYELLGLNAYFVLNQPKSGVTNLMSIWDFDSRYGGAVGKDNISDMLFGSWAAAGELIGGLLANFGIDPNTQSEEAEVLMPIFFNTYENDVGFKKNFLNVGAKAVKKNNFLGKDFRYDVLRRGKTLLDYDSRRGAKVKNQEGDRKYAPIGLRTMFLKPFSYFGSLANHSIAVANARKVSKLVHQVAAYIEDYNAVQEKNGKPLLPQDYQVTSDELGKRLSDKIAFDRLDLDLGHYGLGSLSNLARDYMERRSKGDKRILTKEQIIVSGMIGVNEVALEGGFSTTPAFLNSPYMRWAAPLQKWALNKVKQMNRSFRDLKNGEMDAKAALLMISTIVGLKIPLGLAYTFFWSDWYDEELLGKASPLRPLPKSAMLPLIGPFIEGDPANNLKAMLERVARAGNVGGMALDFVNATYNEFDTYSYNRGFSLDNRILIMSQLLNIRQAMGNMIGMGEIDYANVVRPMMYSMGFNGPIQQYNLFANALGLESEERRISNQIGNRHKLRAGIHTLGIEGRPMVGGTIKKTKFSAALRRMERSAEADDSKVFNEAYKDAIEASIDRGDEDPEDAVMKAFKRRNLKTGISRYKLSDEEWEGILGLYDQEASKPLIEAMRMHEKYVDILDASKPKKGFVFPKPDITIKPVTYDDIIKRSLSF